MNTDEFENMSVSDLQQVRRELVAQADGLQNRLRTYGGQGLGQYVQGEIAGLGIAIHIIDEFISMTQDDENESE